MAALAQATRRALQDYYAGFIRRLTAEIGKSNEPG
jgi:hypothetical protein